jgi:hypothetical protein
VGTESVSGPKVVTNWRGRCPCRRPSELAPRS